MLAPSIFEENFIDELFGFPYLKEFDGMEHDMERKLYGRKASRMMKTDIREKDDNYEISVDLPGFKKEDITVELDNGYITISASKNLDKEGNNKKGKLLRQERYAGSMTRSFYVGENVEKADVDANYRHGVLNLIIPKKAIEKKIPEKNLIAIEG
ncbi:Hsp20/alpha crystallin family protein [Butyrivibrio sp. AE2032]|uniref:Hsp20/alpha crystallin family protein n=1 Tax=Butyrivibrio sp. AE2032 TaxID=1458463 RepID=UPI000554C97A|nr:Hsp20/alpha crystallin family protein [Butyrivibrio sp. AE2032]